MTERVVFEPEDRPVILTVPMVGDTSPAGTVLGGWIMTQIDHAAGRVFAGDCVIRAIHELTFHAPLHAGEDFAVFARVTGTGRTSFKIELEGRSGATLIVSAEVTMICIDEEGRPRPLVK